MVVSAFDIGPVRLRLVAEAAKLEALTLASEWGTLLTPAAEILAEAFRSPFGDHALHLVNGWEGDMNDLGNHLFRLSNACLAAADEEEALAHVVAGGLGEPRRYQDLATAFRAWEGRARQRRLMDASYGDPNRFVAVHPEGIRRAAARLLEASDVFDAARRRLEGPFRDVKLDPPEELRWVAQDSASLAAELRRRADAYEHADQQVQGSATGAFSGPLSALLASAADAVRKAGARLSDPKSQAKDDVKRLLEEVRPSGLFDLADFKKARAILAEAERASAEDPAYAAAFLQALGPKNLRWLIENGKQDPCVLGSLVARASRAGVDLDFLKKTLGSDRFDAPRRAAFLSQCPCPTAQYDPAWVDAMAIALLKGRDPAGAGDPRRWYREAAATLLRNNPAGAIAFINANEGLACRALFSHKDKGGTSAQAGLYEMLGKPGRLEKDAEDALERILTCASQHEFTSEGKRALAELIARPKTFANVTVQLLDTLPGDAVSAEGLNTSSESLQSVLSSLMVESQSRRVLVDGANRFAAERLRLYLEAPDAPNAEQTLKEVGAAFGALGSRPYSLAATLDIQKMAASTAKDLVGAVRGAALNVAKAQPVVSLAIESGSAILFSAGEAVADQQQLAAELRAEQTAAQRLSRLQGDLTNNLKHLTYVTVLADRDHRAGLDLHLSPSDLPEVIPGGLNLSVSNSQEWAEHLFDRHGRLVVPQPTDVGRWKSFLGWARTVNPSLEGRVAELTGPMLEGFDLAAGS